MKKVQIYKVLDCNKVLYRMIEQQNKFPISIGFKIYKNMKKFDEVEEYVFNLMDNTFADLKWNMLNDEQKLFYNKIISEEIELDFDEISVDFFENNEELMLTIEEIENLSLILC